MKRNCLFLRMLLAAFFAAALNFDNCADVELACLTMGHMETGDCSGNAPDFDSCQNIALRTMDLYGCGVYGIHANSCGDLTVSNSTIRDCAYGSVDISCSTGAPAGISGTAPSLRTASGAGRPHIPTVRKIWTLPKAFIRRIWSRPRSTTAASGAPAGSATSKSIRSPARRNTSA